MTEVHVELMGPMRRPWRERSRAVELDPGATVAALLSTLGYNDEEAKHFSVLVNGERVTATRALQARDRVTIALMVGGG